MVSRPRESLHLRGLGVVPTYLVDKDLHWRAAVQSSVRTPLVVEIEPSRQGSQPLVVGDIESGIGPFACQRFDEGFGFAVGLWPVGSSRLMSGTDALQGSLKARRQRVAKAAVCHDSFDPNTEIGEIVSRFEHKGSCCGTRLSRHDPRKGNSGAVVDCNVDELISLTLAPAVMPTRLIVEQRMTASGRNTSQLLDVQVEQLTWALPDIADRDGCDSVEVTKPRQPLSTEDLIDRRPWKSELGPQPMRSEPQLASSADDLADRRFRDCVRITTRLGRLILESGDSSLTVTRQPFVGSSARDASRLRSVGNWPFEIDDALDQKKPTEGCESRITMSHAGPPDGDEGG